MKHLLACLVFAVVVVPVSAQVPAAAASDPVLTAARSTLNRHATELLKSAEEMPADRYGFKPTPTSWTFGQLTFHIASSAEAVCGYAPGAAKRAKTSYTKDSPKADLVAYLKSSLDYCQANLKAMRDSQLGDTFEVKGAAGKVNHVTQAVLVVVLLDDWSDHYSQQAQDLRLNGLLPPSAQPRPKAPSSK